MIWLHFWKEKSLKKYVLSVIKEVGIMKRAIITGATGAIGTALVKELIDNNIEVLILMNPESGRKNNIISNPLVSVLECGMDDYAKVQNKTGKKYDVLFHFAWAGTNGNGRNDMYLQNRNVKYALDAVGMAKRFGCVKFVGAGSQAEYGRVEGMLKPETPTMPEMGYGYAKLCAGQMTREYANQLGLEHVWVRILSVYGPYDGKQSLVMSVINKLREGEAPLCTKGEQLWDYLFSGDAAKAFRLIGDKGVDGKIYVLGSGKARPLRQYIEEIQQEVNPNCEIKLGGVPYAEKQVMYLCADITELTKDTGWQSETRFVDGIKYILG